MNREPDNWRALADALQYAMTETGVEPTQDYVQATALDALAWLEQREYRLLSRPGGVQVNVHPPDPGAERAAGYTTGYMEASQRRGR